MRDCSTNRAGFDRVLMAVAATFLAVSATSALAQAMGPGQVPAELAIDAAVPRPEPANVPPPTTSDFKMDTTATAPTPPGRREKPERKQSAGSSPPNRHPPESKPAETKTDTATTSRQRRTRRRPPQRLPPARQEPVKAEQRARPTSRSPKLREMLGGKSVRDFDRKGERAAVEKFYSAREYAPQWTQAGSSPTAPRA